MIQRTLAFLVVVVCLAALIVGAVNAQEAVQARTAIDLGPLVRLAVEIVAPVAFTILSALATWVLLQFKSRTGLDIDARHRAAIEQGLGRAIGYVVTRIEDRTAGGIPLHSQDRAVVMAAEYAKQAIPDALAHFKIDGARLAKMVEARLEGMLVDPDAERAERHLRSAPIAAAG